MVRPATPGGACARLRAREASTWWTAVLVPIATTSRTAGDSVCSALDTAHHEHLVEAQALADHARGRHRARPRGSARVAHDLDVERDLDFLLDDTHEDLRGGDAHPWLEQLVHGGIRRHPAGRVEARRHERVGDSTTDDVEPDGLATHLEDDGDGVADHDRVAVLDVGLG
jgi:hypothetical protein